MAARQITLALALVACTPAATQYELQSELSELLPCGDEAMQEKLREVMLGALDEALNDHIKNAFAVWMRDPDHDQPRRARTGIRAGTNAYIRARNAVLKFKLMACP